MKELWTKLCNTLHNRPFDLGLFVGACYFYTSPDFLVAFVAAAILGWEVGRLALHGVMYDVASRLMEKEKRNG